MIIGHSVGDANGRILTMDARVCDFMQRPLQQLIGQSYLDLTHPQDRRANITKIAALDGSDDLVEVRKRYLTPGGVTRWVNLQVSRMRKGSDAGLLLGTLILAEPARIQTRTQAEPHTMWQRARGQIRQIEMRAEILGNALGNDHPWAILLHVYVAEAEGRAVDLETIGVSTGIPDRLTQRWLRVLQDRGLIDWHAEFGPTIQLTATGLKTLERLLAATA